MNELERRLIGEPPEKWRLLAGLQYDIKYWTDALADINASPPEGRGGVTKKAEDIAYAQKKLDGVKRAYKNWKEEELEMVKPEEKEDEEERKRKLLEVGLRDKILKVFRDFYHGEVRRQEKVSEEIEKAEKQVVGLEREEEHWRKEIENSAISSSIEKHLVEKLEEVVKEKLYLKKRIAMGIKDLKYIDDYGCMQQKEFEAVQRILSRTQ